MKKRVEVITDERHDFSFTTSLLQSHYALFSPNIFQVFSRFVFPDLECNMFIAINLLARTLASCSQKSQCCNM